jgi:cystinosin
MYWCLTNVEVLGFTAYSFYNVLLFGSKEIREEYHRRHPNTGESGPLVAVNDVFFAIHAAVISLVTLTQIYCWGYTRSRGQFPSPWTWGIVVGGGLAVGILSIIVLASKGNMAEWIDVLYALSYVKLVCTFVKYVPQVISCRYFFLKARPF